MTAVPKVLRNMLRIADISLVIVVIALAIGILWLLIRVVCG